VRTNTSTIAALIEHMTASGTMSLWCCITTPRFRRRTGRRSRPIRFDSEKKKIRYSAMCGAFATVKNPFFNRETDLG
jgi:hypothetical protein